MGPFLESVATGRRGQRRGASAGGQMSDELVAMLFLSRLALRRGWAVESLFCSSGLETAAFAKRMAWMGRRAADCTIIAMRNALSASCTSFVAGSN